MRLTELPGHVVDVGAVIADIEHFRALSTSGTLTVKGFWVNKQGRRIGNSFTGTVDTTTPKTLATISGLDRPAEAVGFRGVFNVAAYYDITPENTQQAADFATNPSNYPQIAVSNDVRIGRVS